MKKTGKEIENIRAEAVRETAVTLNHTINNPLSSIILNTELLLKKNPGLDEDAKRGLLSIQSEVKRIHQALKRLALLKEAVSTEYLKDIKMIDLEKSTVAEKA